ncbi:trypsin-like serine protease [Paraburkholderia caledonica]|uniref:V8-like Glu-specific endopeptidase n=1 Tax=Paraburkholderia caledonica TaxID=134536 RepID=A0AB73INN7_9BURK|nr:V8-like Glu-specific endopeptidase [Paraburkholderia caledonica]
MTMNASLAGKIVTAATLLAAASITARSQTSNENAQVTRALIPLVDGALGKSDGASGTLPATAALPAPVMNTLAQSLRAQVNVEQIVNGAIPSDVKQNFDDEVKTRAALLTLANASGNCGTLLSASPSTLALAAVSPQVDPDLKRRMEQRYSVPALAALQLSGSDVQVICPNTGGGPKYPPPPIDKHDKNPASSHVATPYEFAGFDDVVVISLDGKYQCSGTLASRNWIITAAHCVTDQTNNQKLATDRLRFYKYGETGTDTFTTIALDGSQVTIKGRKARSINQIVVSPRWAAARPDATPDAVADQAILAVDYDGPPTEHIVSLTRKSPAANTPISIVGYGFTGSINDVPGDNPQMGWNSLSESAQNPGSGGWIYLQPSGVGTNCFGDSGGAIFSGHLNGTRNETHELVAIVSRMVDAGKFNGPNPQGRAEQCVGEASVDSLITDDSRRFLCGAAHDAIHGC